MLHFGIFGRLSFKTLPTRGMCDFVATCSKTVDIVTGRHLFPERRNGLTFQVSYVDRRPLKAAASASAASQREPPVVLLLHGAPGSNADFGPQMEALVGAGARVIAPNFPDLPTMLKHRATKFRNTPINKAEYVKDFLRVIGIHRLALLVSHSSGSYTALRLFHSPEELTFDSLAFINPMGHWHTCTRPAWFYRPLSELVHCRPGYALLQAVGMRLLPLISPVKVPNIQDPLTGLTAIRSFDMQEVTDGLLEVASKKPPLLFFFSENDPLLKKQVSYEMLEMLGSPKVDWRVYDTHGHLQTPGNWEKWIRVVSFLAGSHYSLRKHSELVNRHLVAHLRGTRCDSSQLLALSHSAAVHEGTKEEDKASRNQLKSLDIPLVA